ncbi:hypothetical protein RGU72_04985 [Undibacterium sp. 5I1]|uniref:hypothetical protein n=1 Tax=unclassified Undibacterium TaxID=2630295 RepID=UPI002AB419AD|nr:MULTISPECIES: hypothetical protein [unclassified Undibacterium]MDY7537608.1 hypothetical protein [Undibacterium sp. 5I1]MEB0230153.1 hypothetical protein [Undibacterium sp. 10I3]MEB0256345.1 hypothetical protein [Undibacterium sp. 5I1]
MKIKLIQAGYEAFSGPLGDVVFDNGTSVTDVSEQSAGGIASIYQVERIGEPGGVDVGVDDVTDATVNVESDSGDFNAATNEAPQESQ